MQRVSGGEEHREDMQLPLTRSLSDTLRPSSIMQFDLLGAPIKEEIIIVRCLSANSIYRLSFSRERLTPLVR
jgi:hypothetical protein